MPIRTDRTAILVGAAIVAIFTLEVIRTGLVIAAQDRASVDGWVVMALAAGAIYAIVFALLHTALRRRGVATRAAYAGIGAMAALPPFLLAIGARPLVAAAAEGMLSALLLCPVAVGALMGFLYHRRAGYETDGDDPAALALVATGRSPAPHSDDGQALLATDTAEYFDGPLVVRTSLGANALAALLAAAAFVLATTFAAWSGPFRSPLADFMAVNGAGRTLLQGIIGTAIPIMALLGLTHGYLRARGQRRYRDYALAGAVGPVVFSALIATTGVSWFAFSYLLQFLAPSLVATLVYRRLAGLEPAPLPEDIEVSDRRTLVGANHARRRMARIVETGHR